MAPSDASPRIARAKPALARSGGYSEGFLDHSEGAGPARARS
jgi:hypothetical protein